MPEAAVAAAIVLVDIHPSERMQEMEGGEEDTEVAWLAGCRATRDDSP
jgi:hypothetical protein